MNAPLRRNACPSLAEPMQTGDGLLVRLSPESGAFSPSELAALAASAARNGNGIIEVTARGNVQLRGLDHGSVGRLAQQLDDAGIAVRSGVPIDTSPLAGLDAAEIADPRPLVAAIRDGIAAHGLADKLGPKVSVVVDGGGAWPLAKISGDVRCVARRSGDGVMWAISCAGDARTARSVALCEEREAAAKTLDVLVAISQLGKIARARDLPDVKEAPRMEEADLPGSTGELSDSHISAAFRRIPHCPAGHLPQKGEETPAARLSPIANAAELAKRRSAPLPPCGGDVRQDSEGCEGAPLGRVSVMASPEGEERSLAPLGFLPLRDGATALAIALPYGSVTAATLRDFALNAGRLGAMEIRPASGRALIVLGLETSEAEQLMRRAAELGFVIDKTDPRITMSVCTGSPACRSGQIDTRALAAEIARDGASWLAGGLPLHISGCAKGCAHPATAPLTLVGDEKGVGIVVNGTAGAQPLAYSRFDRAASGLARLAGLAHREREQGESVGATLSRIEAHRLVAALRAE